MPSSTLLIKNGQIINRGVISSGDIFIKNDRIEKIASTIDIEADTVIDAAGKWVIPGIIDDQVHFREPGMTYKADIASESRAAIAGGVTTFMEMPNTRPSALTQELLQDKYDMAYRSAYSNYSFFMGASNENIEDVLKTNPQNVCGVKVFMGSSTGNMLVDNEKVLNNIFSNVDMLIATHCEDEATIRTNMAAFQEKYGDNLNATHHPLIRNTEGCLISSTLASTLAKKHNTRLHILHISTAEEISLFTNKIPLAEKRITSEACVHHMYFTADDYSRLGNKIKCNPAIKAAHNRDAIRAAVIDSTIDIIATDHAPHTLEEKERPYSHAPAGLPLVQHALNIMLDMYQDGLFTLEQIVEKMCHTPAICFQIGNRGYIDEGYKADIAIIDPDLEFTVAPDNIAYKCGWSPLEGKTFKGKNVNTIVNGKIVYDYKTQLFRQGCGERLTFTR
jgi:dihydroorotase